MFADKQSIIEPTHEGGTIDDDLNIHDASFRRHYQLKYGEGPLDYESFYAPAYRYGYELSAQYPTVEWQQIESQARFHWASQHHNVSWRTVVDAVRYGWIEERSPDRHRVHHRRRNVH